MPRIIRGHIRDLNAAAEWARSLCRIVYGTEAGEACYRRLPASVVLSLMTRLPTA